MHRLVAVNMSRQEKLDANAEAIQQIELVTQLKKKQIIMVMLRTHGIMSNLCFF